MKNIITGLILLLAFNTNSQIYEATSAGMSNFVYIFADSTITSKEKNEIISVDEGFKKRVSDIVVTYYKTYDDGTTEMYQILNTDKDKVDIIITTTDVLSGEKYKYTIRAKRIN